MPLKGAHLEVVRRVVVHLSKDHRRPRRAQFQQSVVDHFGANHEDRVTVNCGLFRRRLLISDREFTGSAPVLLQRPPFCPLKHLSAARAAVLPAEIRDRGVDVGVAVLLQTPSREVLLTRRAKDLSIFPNVWVPPGGDIEPDEEVLDAGLRELREETGLWLRDGEFSWRTLGLWESVYPPMLSRGPPKRHHIVIYLLLLSHRSRQQLQVRLKPNRKEVSAYTWLAPHVLEAVAAPQDGVRESRMGSADLQQTVRITELENGSSRTVSVPTAVFLTTAPSQGEDTERVSTGTKFALRLWLNTVT